MVTVVSKHLPGASLSFGLTVDRQTITSDSGSPTLLPAAILKPFPGRSRSVSPGLRELVTWMALAPAKGSRTTDDAHQGKRIGSACEPVPAAMPPVDVLMLDALATSVSITNAIRLLPLGFRPGVMGGRVGLLCGLRTDAMEKYDEAVNPKRRRAPPTDLSGLTAEQVVARRNRLAREYSKHARRRRDAAETMLERDVGLLRFAHDAVESAPGVVLLTLSGDMRCLVLHANRAAEDVSDVAPAALLGRSFADLVHPDDRAAFFRMLVILVLRKNPEYRTSLCFRVCGARGKAQRVHASFRFGVFGIACSLWM